MGAKIRFRVQADKLEAVMQVELPDEEYVVTAEEIDEALSAEGICFGILTENIQAAVESQSFDTEIVCAEGIMPVPGTDGTIKFTVPTETELRPKIRDDGTADYHDLGLINEIDEGRLLCRRTRPADGTDGTDVYGQAIPFPPGKYPEFPAGEGTAVSAFSDTKLVASRNGYIKFEKGIISVPDTFVLNGDVSNATGDIRYRGDVVVNGSIRDGFRVVSDGNVTVKGSAEGATIIAGGNVVVTEGFMGMDIGTIYAGGDVKGSYFQNAIVKCGGTLTAQYALNSYLAVGKDIVADGGRGTLAGGEAYCCGSVFVKKLGADSYIATKVTIDDLPMRFWDPNFDPVIEKDGQSGEESEKEILTLPASPDAKIVAKTCAFPEVKIQMGMNFFNVKEEMKCTKFSICDGEITTSSCF